MAKKYTIREGFSFRDDNGEVKIGGEQIDLEDDVAREHLHKLEEVGKALKRPPKPKEPGDDGDSDAAAAAAGAPAADSAITAGAEGGAGQS